MRTAVRRVFFVRQYEDFPMAKQPVRVHIFNQAYTLLTDGEAAEVHRAAEEIDQLMTSLAGRGNAPDPTRIAVLACLHLADRLHSAERKLEGFEDRSARLAGLLRQTITD
jgi:cell division protein ZapA